MEQIAVKSPTREAVDSSDLLISVPMQQFEALLRRIVHETVEEVVDKAVHKAVRQELQGAKLTKPLTIGEDWSHEGPDDPEGDAELLAEALITMEKYKTDKSGWMSWDEFKAELERAEAAGELPA